MPGIGWHCLSNNSGRIFLAFEVSNVFLENGFTVSKIDYQKAAAVLALDKVALKGYK